MRPLVLPPVLGLFAAATPALAVGEGEWQLSGVAGAAVLGDDGGRRAGGTLGVEVAYGFADAWAARASLDTSLHGRGGRLDRATGVGAGLTWAWDVLRVVPFVDAGVRLVDVDGTGRRGALAGELGAGAEYLLSRAWAAGAVVRAEHGPLTFGGAGGSPTRLTLALRLGRALP